MCGASQEPKVPWPSIWYSKGEVPDLQSARLCRDDDERPATRRPISYWSLASISVSGTCSRRSTQALNSDRWPAFRPAGEGFRARGSSFARDESIWTTASSLTIQSVRCESRKTRGDCGIRQVFKQSFRTRASSAARGVAVRTIFCTLRALLHYNPRHRCMLSVSFLHELSTKQ